MTLYNILIIKYCIRHEDEQIFAHTPNISIDCVRSKKCKSDCTDDIFSDNFINGTELLFSMVFIITYISAYTQK